MADTSHDFEHCTMVVDVLVECKKTYPGEVPYPMFVWMECHLSRNELDCTNWQVSRNYMFLPRKMKLLHSSSSDTLNGPATITSCESQGSTTLPVSRTKFVSAQPTSTCHVVSYQRWRVVYTTWGYNPLRRHHSSQNTPRSWTLVMFSYWMIVLNPGPVNISDKTFPLRHQAWLRSYVKWRDS